MNDVNLKTQVIYGQSFDDYFRVPALGSGGINKLLRSPQHFKHSLDNPGESSERQALGIGVHCATLQPSLYLEKYGVTPDVDKRTKLGKAELEEWTLANPDRIGISIEQHRTITNCAASIYSHPAARRLLEQAKCEVSIYWDDQEYAIPCKARFDALNLGGAIDLKTAADASKEAFAAAIARYGYHEQTSHYWTGHEHCFNASPEFWCWIVVESEPPHAVAVYQCGMATLLAGRQRCNEAYGRYRDALRSGQWRGYPETIEVIEVPTWARRF
jgi:exodeoxyribonuclease VIII